MNIERHISNLKQYIKDDEIIEKDGSDFANFCKGHIDDIQALIDYIKIMHKEFDRLEGIEDNTAMLKKELEESKKETQGIYDDYQDLGKEYYKLQCELEKAEKVIDEMAEYIDNITFVDEKGDYGCDFELLTKTTCKYNGNCKECIKEYFYKKVSDNK